MQHTAQTAQRLQPQTAQPVFNLLIMMAANVQELRFNAATALTLTSVELRSIGMKEVAESNADQ